MPHASFRPVHAQLVDMFVMEILEGNMKPGDELPRTVDFALKCNLNPSIIREAYKELVAIKVAQIIENGWKVTDNAVAVLRELERKRFLRDDVPALARRMDLLGIAPQTIDWDTARQEAADAAATAAARREASLKPDLDPPLVVTRKLKASDLK